MTVDVNGPADESSAARSTTAEAEVESDGLTASVAALEHSLHQALEKLGQQEQEAASQFSTLREEFASLTDRYEALKAQWQAEQEARQQEEADQEPPPIGDASAPDMQQTSKPPEATVVAQPIQPSGGMELDLFGDALAEDPTIASERSRLLDGLAAERASALSLLGQLLLFRGADEQRIPQLLGEVGEAYYRWRQQEGITSDALRDALIFWLGERCQAENIGNKIELVRAGDRFDPQRHNAQRRGVEVTEVLGWIVLRENGKVYTRASVEVK